MKKTTKPTADELAQAAAIRLQLFTGWYVTRSGGRITARLTPAQVDRVIERLTNSDKWEASMASTDNDPGGGVA